MSEMSTLLNAGLLQYLINHTTPEPEFFKQLRQKGWDAGFPHIAIAPEQGVFIQVLLGIAGAKTVLEIGTLYGYSALVLAEAVGEGGHVDTIDNDPKSIEFSMAMFADCEWGDRVTAIQGDGLSIMSEMSADTYDALLIDADKEHYIEYLSESRRLLKPGGLLMVDNAFAYGQLLDDEPVKKKDDVWAIRAFNDRMAELTDIQGVIVPIGDGMWIARHR